MKSATNHLLLRIVAVLLVLLPYLRTVQGIDFLYAQRSDAVSTNSLSYVNIPGMALTFRADRDDVIIRFCSYDSISNNGATTLRVILDNTVLDDIVWAVQDTTATPKCFMWVYATNRFNVHAVLVQYKTNSAASLARMFSRTLTVENASNFNSAPTPTPPTPTPPTPTPPTPTLPLCNTCDSNNKCFGTCFNAVPVAQCPATDAAIDALPSCTAAFTSINGLCEGDQNDCSGGNGLLNNCGIAYRNKDVYRRLACRTS